ncbi:translocation/assembly module TamB domain-containing protein [Xenophilus arseniciresistens]|uniref:Translocation/assembly module TamB domain-containing protein n=1 Tax=Xenophilus arseniciresistens TaxID=1283306 RepID=A0AAE3SXY2_9BURK|nr:translocation/assembly module TamB domain-containing protein [Xenophilus arseniciresistens]MDA7415429.1 translocation/assembly module TamB domain-containing protein [Xenophilus arseniciresistens]
MDEQTLATHTAASSAPRRRRGRRVLRWLGWSLAGLAALLIALGGALWWWAGTDQSLAATLARVARLMPAGQTLETREVSGSVRRGGHIDHLQWRSDAMQVTVQDADIGWLLRPLLSRKVQLGEVRAAHVRIESFPQPDKPAEPLQPLQGLPLPVDVDLPFKVQTIEWVGPPALTVQALAGRYRYEGQAHHLQLDGVDVADGHYSGTMKLQGPAPMDLKLALQGRVQAALQEGEAPLQLQAQASATGQLAGPDARLAVEATLQPAGEADPARPVDALLKANIAPWAPQPVVDALARLRNIDAAWLLPQAPRTQLSGEITVRPDESAGTQQAWALDAELRNAAAAPWDEGGLPVQALQAQLHYNAAEQAVRVREARIEAGRGSIEAQGEWRPAPAPWQIEATVRDLRPGLLHTQLAGAPIRGEIKATQKAAGAESEGTVLDFDVDLQAAGEGAGARALEGLNLQLAQARGRWSLPAQLLELRNLRVQAARVDVRGQGQARIAEQAGSAKLQATLPGASLDIDGRMAPAQGNGQAQLQLRDASALQGWVESLPGLSKVFAGNSLRGEARLDARWQGGWQSFMQQLQNPGQPLPRGSAEPTVNARLEVPSLALQQAAADAQAPRPAPVLLRGVRATLEGRLAQASLALQGQAERGTQRLSLDTQASGGLQRAGEWRLQLARLRAQAQDVQAGTQPQQQLAPWTLALTREFSSQVRISQGLIEVQGSAAGVTLNGPVPGTVSIDWEPLRLQQRSGAQGASLRLQSKGRMRGLPMAWARAFGGDASLREMGISGDLVFDGDWDIDAADRLRAQARVARASGDLRVQAGEAALVRRIESRGTGTRSEITMTPTDEGPGTPAGLRQAELLLRADGDALQASLVWDSERAGTINAEAGTRLVQQGGGWQWAPDAPLSGRVRAALPQLGVWSMLAPPGWRVAGSLQADATLGGNRAEPRWNGTLAADQLALRARVEGLDLRDGRLRATLAGDRMRIDEFTLQGGQASRVRIAGRGGNLSTVGSELGRDGGRLTVRGEAQWSASAPRIDLQAEVQRLRALVRTDRQVTVSGNLQTRLQDGQLQVRGKITADRAAIILPDESAPSLGSDVVVRSAAIEKEAREKAEREARARSNADAQDAEKPQQPLLRRPPDIELSFDLGNDFAVQGRGITTRLEGALDIRANSLTAAPRVTGEVRTVQGQYRAYGQALDVESGLARFNGVVDNPQLDIFALRPNITQRAGVRITGSAQAPRVALYSDPVLSDAETLSWVILGRASAASGGEAILMQQAALALLGGLGKGQSGGSLASRFGLDEIGFKGPGGGELTESSVTLGKRLSKDFYVTYERSLAGALGTLFIFYDLTRNLTLRGQAGQQSAVDLIYTVKYD